MSYDLTFLPVAADGDLARALEAMERRVEEEFSGGGSAAGDGPVDPILEERQRRIAADIQAHHPSLQPFVFDYEKIAELQKCSIEEARRQNRHIELNEAESVLGLQITVWDDHVSMTLPYWQELGKADAAFEVIGRIGAMLHASWSMRAFDPQLEREVVMPLDVAEMIGVYGGTIDRVRVPHHADRPWWKFWKR